MSDRLKEFARAWRKVFGVPDYDAYVEHMRVTHPGERPLARGEFLAWALERRHAGRGARCC
ncbi:MAG TPA: YbdD/YjiX family protein [Burkholderiales bacterium]|nr:YbdD/YjiX family protein [Burkholderiales bacterium]